MRKEQETKRIGEKSLKEKSRNEGEQEGPEWSIMMLTNAVPSYYVSFTDSITLTV